MRAVFIIDDKGIVRAMVYYPLNAGRNVDELLRLIDALQTSDREGVSCPANWTPVTRLWWVPRARPTTSRSASRTTR